MEGGDITSNCIRTLAVEMLWLRTDDNGCHFLHVYDELRKLLIYLKLSKAALHQCITVLETSSDIIETDRQRYITVT